METELSHSGLRFELSRGIVAECGVAPPPIIEYRDVLEGVLCGLAPRAGLAMSSRFRVPKKLATQALSQQFPRLDRPAGHTEGAPEFRTVW